MISHRAFACDAWCLRIDGLDQSILAQMESVLALSNGHIGWRGNLDEGEPHGLPGSYLAGVYEQRPLPYAEAGYGYPEEGQTVVNVTNAKLIRLLVDDEPLDIRYGEVLHHRYELDFRAGVLRRELVWRSPSRRRVRVLSTRVVSFTQRPIAAVRYEVEALDGPTRIVLQSELVANEELPSQSADPRASVALHTPWVAESHTQQGTRLGLIHRTASSGLRVAVAMDHEVEGPPHQREHEVSPDLARHSVLTTLDADEVLRVTKVAAFGWSSTRSLPALRDQVDAALAAAMATGWDGLLQGQRAYLDAFWANADIEIDGDEDLQHSARFAAFHILQAGARAEGRAVAAKGLTGNGYDGHAFWDTEMFVLPMLTYTLPGAAADALSWRHATLSKAEERARQLGHRGAAFPWRTISGEEGSAYWPAGTAAFHINADVAHAALRYVEATGDVEFERTTALELLVGTARLWCSIGSWGRDGRFEIHGVTGPDEYSALVDNNVYTNVMAQQNLAGAARLAQTHPHQAANLGVDTAEIGEWERAASQMHLPFDERLGVHPQDDSFTSHDRWDFASTPADAYPLFLHYPYFDLYRKQVVKQSDLVMAMHVRSRLFSLDQKRRNFDYYEPLTVRDSSLSAISQAVVAAELDYLELAHAYAAEVALMDLDDLQHNTRDGLHIASLGGVWIALVSGFGGMRHEDDSLSFNPRLPPGINRLRFALLWRGDRLGVDVAVDSVTYRYDGPSVTVEHCGEQVELTRGLPRTLPLQRPAARPEPHPPPKREPLPREVRRQPDGTVEE